MTSFVIGRVVAPEVRPTTVKGAQRRICSLGVLSGHDCIKFDIWDDAKVFEKASSLKDGNLVLAFVNASLDGRGTLRHYLNGIVECPDALSNQLLALAKQ